MSSPQPYADLISGLILYLIIAGGTAYYAQTKGKNPYLWFAIALLLGIFAPIILFVLTLFPNKEKDPQQPPSWPMEIMPIPEAQLKSEAPIQTELPKKIDDSRLWYYLDKNHQQMGPVSIIGLREEWNRGLVDLESYVWAQGMSDWKKIDDQPDLKKLLSEHH